MYGMIDCKREPVAGEGAEIVDIAPAEEQNEYERYDEPCISPHIQARLFGCIAPTRQIPAGT